MMKYKINITIVVFIFLLISIFAALLLTSDMEDKTYNTLYDFLYYGIMNKFAMNRIFAWQDDILNYSVVFHHFLFFIWLVLGGIVLYCSIGVFFWIKGEKNIIVLYKKIMTFLIGIEMVFMIVGTRYAVVYLYTVIIFILWVFVINTAKER